MRYEVFVHEIGAFSRNSNRVETDPFDQVVTQIIAMSQGQVIGTCRVMTIAPAWRQPSTSGAELPGEAHYDYGSLLRDGLHVAEVSRSAVHPTYRGSAVLPKLWKTAYNYAKLRGATHIMGIVQVGCTDSLVDARLVHDTLGRHGLLHPRYVLSERRESNGPAIPAVPLYSDAERIEGKHRMPPVFRLYHRFGLRACARPVFISEIGRVGMAMLAGPETFSPETSAFFSAPDPTICLD